MFRTPNRLRRVKQVSLFLPVAMIGLMLASFTVTAPAQTIHQFSYNNSTWIDQNLFSAATDLHTGIASFVTTPNNLTHTFYLDSADNVHQLFFNGSSWSEENLTAEGFGPAAMHKSAVTGFSIQNFQYVYYVAQNQHVHQLLYDNVEWADSDLTALGGGLLSSKTPRLAALTTGGNALHVYYLASNNHIIQLYNVSGTWTNQDLTKTAKAPSSRAVWISAVNIGNFQYVYYVAPTGDVHELYYNNSTWADKDLTIASGAMLSSGTSGVTATVISGSPNIIEVFMIAKNNHVQDFFSADNIVWGSQDLTADSGGPAANPANGMVAFATTPNNEMHVFYLSKKHVNQLFLPTGTGTWNNTDLTAVYHGPSASGTSAMAGFSLQNFQYVYYVAQ